MRQELGPVSRLPRHELPTYVTLFVCAAPGVAAWPNTRVASIASTATAVAKVNVNRHPVRCIAPPRANGSCHHALYGRSLLMRSIHRLPFSFAGFRATDLRKYSSERAYSPLR